MSLITTYDVRGKEIIILEHGRRAAGNYEVLWNGVDQSGHAVSAGVYFCRLQAGGYSETIKMVYLR